MESLLRLTRAKGFVSEDDLDKATCWVHDISDVVNLHEIAEIAKNKDIKNKEMVNEIKLLKRDLENCTESLKKFEHNERILKEENIRQKSELDKLKLNLEESMMLNSRIENENERLKNKIRVAHQEIRKRVDDHLLD